MDLCSPWPLSPTKAESIIDMRAVINALPASRANAASAAAAMVPGKEEKGGKLGESDKVRDVRDTWYDGEDAVAIDDKTFVLLHKA